MSFGPGIVPIPGATRLETASSLARALGIELDDDDRRAIDARFSGRLLRVPRAERRPRDDATGEVVIVMGMPGAGKTMIALELVADGYRRLNRDEMGGSLADLAPRLDALLASGQDRIVLDNTYPTRQSRNEIIETAWERGVSVRCIWLATDVANAQVNAIHRMIDAHGSLPSPEVIRQLGKKDTRYFLPDAQFRYERTLESPTADEGFVSLETRAFVRDISTARARALILDLDDLLGRDTPALIPNDVTIPPEHHDTLVRHRDEGWLVFVHAWRPQVARSLTTPTDIDRCFARVRELLGGDVEMAYCPHDAGPPVCWCRKPIPGSVIELAMRRGVALSRSMVIGTSAADRTMAERIGASFAASESFWPSGD
jgi:histidinol phosphatase-like enzyme